MKARLQNNPLPGEPVDATPALPPQPVTLQGRFGSIEKLDAKKHGRDLWLALAGHDSVWTYLKVGPYQNEKFFMDFLRDRAETSDPCAYAILDRENRALGSACLMEIHPDMRVIEVGSIIYSPALQRTPLGTEAQYLLMRYAFKTLKYRRYEWKCNALNAGSRRAAERYGFTFEGVFRQHEIIKGRNRDTAWYSILDCEWPKQKHRFETWLAPENFDADGVQKKPLMSS